MKGDIVLFLKDKLAAAEKELRCHEEMSRPQPRISEEKWERIKAMPGTRVTMGRKMSKAALKAMAEEPLRHKRIAAKCRHEVDMFKAAIAELSK